MGATAGLYPDEPATTSSATWKHVGSFLLYELAFLLAYRYGMMFPRNLPAPLWIPDSIILTALLLTPRRTWWLYILGTLPIRLLLFVPPEAPAWFVPLCTVNDCAKNLLVASFLRSETGQAHWFETLKGFLRYLRAAVLLGPGISALAGAAGVSAASGVDFVEAAQMWYLGDALANLTVTPVLYCLVGILAGRTVLAKPRWGETAALAAGVVVTAMLSFGGKHPHGEYPPFLLYLPVPFVLWAAIRLGPFALSLSLSALTALAVQGTLEHRGPFSEYSGAGGILELQLFLFVFAIPFLALAALISDREHGQQQLNRITNQLIGAQESERNRIGQELHDDVGQRLVALSWGLAALSRRPDEGVAKLGSRLRQEANEISRDIIRLSRELRPASLKGQGLVPALQRLAQQASDANEIPVTCSSPSDATEMPEDVALALYRVAQEALRNALTHSKATGVTIELSESHAGFGLTIADNGKGFAVESTKAGGLGLANMEARVQNKGGTLRINTAPGKGTRVTAWIPRDKKGAGSGSVSDQASPGNQVHDLRRA